MIAFAPRRGRLARASPRPAVVGGALLCWALAAAALVLGAASACQDAFCAPPLFDRDVLAALHAWRTPVLDGLMLTTTWLGSIAVLLPAALLFAWRFWLDDHLAAALLLPGAVAGSWLFAHAGKLLVARPRPDLYPALIQMPADLSFPSAHAMQFTAFALALLLAPGLRRASVVIIAAVALLVALVALSRLYLQVHYPSDVLAGVIAGACWASGLRLVIGTRA